MNSAEIPGPAARRVSAVLAAAALLRACAVFAAEPSPVLPGPAVRRGIIAALKTEVERVDGDGLLPRAARPASWDRTVALLEDEAARAGSPEEFGRVLKRFDASIPNLHMRGYLREQFEPYSRPPAPFAVAAESVADEARPGRYRVASVSSAAWSSEDAPRVGDELLAINERPMAEWSDENFDFCKFPLRSQCEREFSKNLWNEMLSWKRPEPLSLRLRRAGRSWDALVPEPQYSVPESPGDGPRPNCGVEEGRYPGFSPVYAGVNACVFSSASRPGVFVLRIPSFRYEESGVEPIEEEVRRLNEGFWKQRSSEIKILIVDVIGNLGGGEPIPYYRLLFKKPFQEQFAQYKKIRELDGDDEAARRLWDSAWADENWLAGIRRDGRFAATPVGGFLPIRPQFCADERDCEHSVFSPLAHRFDGRVLLLMNRDCISACAGFVWNLVDVLKGRVRTFGEPDSGDSTFARLFLDVILDPKDPRGFRIRLDPYDARQRGGLGDAFYRQTVSITRTTDARGNVISGLPQKIDVRVPARWDQTEEDWSAAVFAAALAQSGP